MFRLFKIEMSPEKAAKYFTEEFGQEDYYIKGSEPSGQWYDGGSSLNMSGNVKKEDFLNILKGQTLDGKKVIQIGGREKVHTPGFDVPLSAPKDISILYARANGRDREIIRKCHDNAVKSTLNYIEENLLGEGCRRVKWEVRNGKKERIVNKEKPRGLLCALFEHRSSRELDPQLHTHAIIANMVERNDGTWGALNFTPLYNNQRILGALYRAELAQNLEKNTGFKCKRTEFAFEVEGISDRLRKENSKRRQAILSELKNRGKLGDHNEAQKVAIVTRNRKENVSNDVLFDQWQGSFDEIGFTKEKFYSMMKKKRKENEQSREEDAINFVVSKTIKSLTKDEGTFSEKELFDELAIQSQTVLGISGYSAAKKVVLDNTNLIKVGVDSKGLSIFTGRDNLEKERAVVKHAKDILSKNVSLKDGEIAKAITKYEKKKKFTLNLDQKMAIVHSLRKNFSLIEGYAGTGKSTSMEVIKDALEKKSYQVQGLTPTHKAAHALRDSQIKTMTVDKALFMLHKNSKYFPKKTAFIIDEAGMIGTDKMSNLLKYANKMKARVILVGDSNQHSPIERGAPFKLLLNQISGVRISEVMRQKNAKQKEAGLLIREGRGTDGLKTLYDEGLVKFSEKHEKSVENLVADYLRSRNENPKQRHAIITQKNAEVDQINKLVRQGLVKAKFVSKRGKIFQVTDAKGKKVEREFAKGDEIILRDTNPKLGITNGMKGKISKIKRDNLFVDIEVKQVKWGKLKKKIETIRVPLSKVNKVDYAYAGTSYSQQGETVDSAFMLASTGDTLSEGYVSLTRQTQCVKLYGSQETFFGVNWKTFERRLDFEDRQDIKDRNMIERIGASFERLATNKNALDYLEESLKEVSEAPNVFDEPSSFLVAPEITDLSSKIMTMPKDQDLVKALRRVYLTAPASHHIYDTPTGIAPWQKKAFVMIKHSSFEIKARAELCKLIEDAKEGVHSIHSEKLERELNDRRELLGPSYREALKKFRGKEQGQEFSIER